MIRSADQISDGIKRLRYALRVITMTRGWQIPTSRIRDLVSELYSPTLSLADLEPAQQRQVIRSALLEELKGV